MLMCERPSWSDAWERRLLVIMSLTADSKLARVKSKKHMYYLRESEIFFLCTIVFFPTLMNDLLFLVAYSLKGRKTQPTKCLKVNVMNM